METEAGGDPQKTLRQISHCSDSQCFLGLDSCITIGIEYVDLLGVPDIVYAVLFGPGGIQSGLQVDAVN